MIYTLNVQISMLKHIFPILNTIYHGLVISLHIIYLIISSVLQNQTLVLVKYLQKVLT